jgi:hypothetical protein
MANYLFPANSEGDMSPKIDKFLIKTKISGNNQALFEPDIQKEEGYS